jgi:hypothetical protein
MPQLEDLSDVRNFLTHNSNETHMNIFWLNKYKNKFECVQKLKIVQ